MEHFLTPIVLLLIVLGFLAFMAFIFIGLICAWIVVCEDENVGLKSRLICGLIASLAFILVWGASSYSWSLA